MFLTPIMESICTNGDPLYSPINEFTQSELMEKFNLAFYEAQAVSRYDIIDTFKNFNSSPKTSDLDNGNSINDDYLIDYFISEDSTVSPTDCDINFDFNDFVEDFDENVKGSFSMSTGTDFDTEALTTENSADLDSLLGVQQFSLSVPPPVMNNKKDVAENTTTSKSSESDKEFDIKFCEVLSNSPLDIGQWSSEIQDEEDPPYDYPSTLPPVGTITKSNFDFNCYVRSVPNNDLGYLKQDLEGRSEFGHLIEAPGFKSYGSQVNYYDNDNTLFSGQNHMILTKSDALSNLDPLLSDTNTYKNTSLTERCTDVAGEEESVGVTLYQCKWQNCYKKWSSQDKLVVHIEKCHVEIRRGDEFTCYWEQCPRKTKAFNARYKLLIHMRVHTGEKPNKCPFKDCNKAFSRLENLKIHQRSHTGERPYRCTFTGCTKCFSNSSDRAKHQRTHFDTKPYACQVKGCSKKYTDPSSLRKHVKNHSYEEQQQVKNKSHGETLLYNDVKPLLDSSKPKEVKNDTHYTSKTDHTYSNVLPHFKKYASINVKQDLKNKIERNKIQRTMF